MAEAHEFGGQEHCGPKHTTACEGLGRRRAARDIAVVDSWRERGSVTKRRAPPRRRARLLTIQLREAQAIDRLDKVREVRFTA